jgi:hypothetical protein
MLHPSIDYLYVCPQQQVYDNVNLSSVYSLLFSTNTITRLSLYSVYRGFCIKGMGELGHCLLQDLWKLRVHPLVLNLALLRACSHLSTH